MKLPKKYDEQTQESSQGINTFIGAGDKRPSGRKKVKGLLNPHEQRSLWLLLSPYWFHQYS